MGNVSGLNLVSNNVQNFIIRKNLLIFKVTSFFSSYEILHPKYERILVTAELTVTGSN